MKAERELLVLRGERVVEWPRSMAEAKRIVKAGGGQIVEVVKK
jgi:hypothetical protein